MTSRRRFYAGIWKRCRTRCPNMNGMTKFALLLVLIGLPGLSAAQKRTAPELISLAATHSPELRSAIEASFDAKNLKEGTGWLGRGPEFFFAVESASAPTLLIDDAAGPAMMQLPGTQL